MDTSIWWTTVSLIYSPKRPSLQLKSKQTKQQCICKRENHTAELNLGLALGCTDIMWSRLHSPWSDVFCNHLCFCRQPCHFHLSHLGCLTGFNGESKILWLFQCVCLHTNTDFLFLFREHCSIQNITCSCSPVYFSPDTSMTHQKRV